MQFEFTALQGVINDLKNLKQEFELTKVFKLNKYIIKMAYFKSSTRIKQKSRKVVHEERLKNRTFKN